jgi:acyl-coenzyme A synthetase/AMP-(fatty) acid ligase
MEHPAVLEAAVIGIPDELRGQAVKAFILLASSHEASADLAEGIRAHVSAITAPYKTPKYVEFVTELPKTISGKIRRVELREREAKR